MATSYYSTGTVSLENGSAVITGNGTLWQAALITNGFLFVQAEGNSLPIATVDADDQITAELEWTGATGTYSYAILRQTDQLQDNAENSRALSYLISEMRNGTLFKYDVAGTLADRSIYNERPKGFSYLVLVGTTAQLYVKASATSGDWAGPFAYGTGPTGPMGPAGFTNWRGTYAAGTSYQRNDGVLYNGSSWVALQSTTGNAPPNLPTTENAYWSLLAVKGQDGTGTGDVVGPASAVADRIAVFSGTTGKLIEDGGKLVGDIVTGPASSVNNRVAVFDSTTGKLLKDGGKTVEELDAVKSGALVQTVVRTYATWTALTASIPIDDTIPLLTEGTWVINEYFTPKFADSIILMTFSAAATASGLGGVSAFIGIVGQTSALAASRTTIQSANSVATLVVEAMYEPGSVDEFRCVASVGSPSGTTAYLNGSASARTLGGASRAVLEIREIRP